MNDKSREDFLKDLKKHGVENDIPNVSEVWARFLRDLIQLTWAKRCLEIGTASWYSSINMAIELEKIWWKIITIDFSEKSFLDAKKNIEDTHLGNTITQVFWNALTEIPLLSGEFDFVFIDGMKRRTKDFLELCYPKVSAWWLIIIDDVILFKDKMVWLYEFLEENNIGYNIIPVDVNDGVAMILK